MVSGTCEGVTPYLTMRGCHIWQLAAVRAGLAPTHWGFRITQSRLRDQWQMFDLVGGCRRVPSVLPLSFEPYIQTPLLGHLLRQEHAAATCCPEQHSSGPLGP